MVYVVVDNNDEAGSRANDGMMAEQSSSGLSVQRLFPPHSSRTDSDAPQPTATATRLPRFLFCFPRFTGPYKSRPGQSPRE